MDDTLTSIIGLAVAVILMFIFPLITMSDRTDDVSQLTVDIATTEFVDDIRESGKITPDRYSKYIESIGSTGNTYNIELEVKILDENPKRKAIELNKTMETTDNVYYSVYNSQIENELNNGNDYYLKEGDIVTLVDVDFTEYRKRNENRAVRKNVTIPYRVCAAADKEDINYSKVLTEALEKLLGMRHTVTY